MKATLALFFVLLASASALAQARAAIMTTLEGHVTVTRGEQPVTLPLKFKDYIFVGDERQGQAGSGPESPLAR